MESEPLLLEDAMSFVQNVVELKPGVTYVVAFQAISTGQLHRTMQYLKEHGMDCLGVALQEGHELTIIEAPAS